MDINHSITMGLDSMNIGLSKEQTIAIAIVKELNRKGIDKADGILALCMIIASECAAAGFDEEKFEGVFAEMRYLFLEAKNLIEKEELDD